MDEVSGDEEDVRDKVFMARWWLSSMNNSDLLLLLMDLQIRRSKGGMACTGASPEGKQYQLRS